MFQTWECTNTGMLAYSLPDPDAPKFDHLLAMSDFDLRCIWDFQTRNTQLAQNRMARKQSVRSQVLGVRDDRNVLCLPCSPMCTHETPIRTIQSIVRCLVMEHSFSSGLPGKQIERGNPVLITLHLLTGYYLHSWKSPAAWRP